MNNKRPYCMLKIKGKKCSKNRENDELRTIIKPQKGGISTYFPFLWKMKEMEKQLSFLKDKENRGVGQLPFIWIFHFCFNLLLRAHQEAAEKRFLAGVIFLKALEGVKIATLRCLEIYSCRAKAAVLSSRGYVHLCMRVCGDFVVNIYCKEL